MKPNGSKQHVHNWKRLRLTKGTQAIKQPEPFEVVFKGVTHTVTPQLLWGWEDTKWIWGCIRGNKVKHIMFTEAGFIAMSGTIPEGWDKKYD